MAGYGITQCEDFMLFQKALKKLREIDDKIIYALNQSTPTASFQVYYVLLLPTVIPLTLSTS